METLGRSKTVAPRSRSDSFCCNSIIHIKAVLRGPKRLKTDGRDLWKHSGSDDIRTISDTLKSDLPLIRQQEKSLFDAQIQDMHQRNAAGQTWNWPSSILRISIISLLIFLIQILMQLYRYNSRLIAFYGSRRDALMLSAGDSAETEVFSRIFMPSGLDFGRQPNSPLLEIGRFWPWRRAEQSNHSGQRRNRASKTEAQTKRSAKPASVKPASKINREDTPPPNP